jgi:hypothetical protein
LGWQDSISILAELSLVIFCATSELSWANIAGKRFGVKLKTLSLGNFEAHIFQVMHRCRSGATPRRPCLALVGCVRETVRPGRLARRRLAPSVSDGARKLAQWRHRMRLHPEGQECHGQTRRPEQAYCVIARAFFLRCSHGPTASPATKAPHRRSPLA